MRSIYRNMMKQMGLALVLVPFATTTVFAERPSYTIDLESSPAKKQKLTSKITNGYNTLYIYDDNKVKTYSVYKRDGAKTPNVVNGKDGKPLKDKDGNCQKKVKVQVAHKTGGAYRVQWVSCTDAEEQYAWYAQNFHRGAGEAEGQPDTWVDAQVAPQHDLDFADMNHDGIIDVVVLDGEADEIRVLLGIGDGSLQDPLIGTGRIVQLPRSQ